MTVGWGARFVSPTLDGVLADLVGYAPLARDEIARAKARYLARHATELVDAEATGGEPAGNALSRAWRALRDAMDCDDPACDLTFSVVCCPFEGRVYGHVVVGQRSFGAAMHASDIVDGYEWDDGERPDHVPETEWAERERVWRGILAGSSAYRPADVGMRYDFLDDHRRLSPEDCLAEAPSREWRVTQAARRLACGSREAEMRLSEPHSILSWLVSDEANAAAEALRPRAEALLPALDVATLTGRRSLSLA